MSFFCTISKSKSGPYVSKIASRQFFTFLYPKTITHRRYLQAEPENEGTSAIFRNWFIRALVRVGNCKEHASKNDSSRLAQRPSHFNFFSRRKLHTKSSSASAIPAPNSEQEEFINIVDYYDNPFEEPAQIEHLTNLQKPDIIVSDKREDEEWPPEEYRWSLNDPGIQEKVQKLEEALQLEKHEKDHEDIFELYSSFPSPRAPYIPAKTRHRLLYYLALSDRKDERTILRFLSVIDDMKATAIPLLVKEWNMTIYYAGKFVNKLTDVQLENALLIWREMERSAGVPGNHATFNILFDMAIKVGKYNLADMIYEEMLKRGHVFNRFHYVTKIYYHGLRQDGDSARKAYKELVLSGEIVDTVVLNCLICALLKSQEAQSAILIYERMKALHAKKSGGNVKLPPRKFKDKLSIKHYLIKAADLAKNNDEMREKFQAESIVAPDITTFEMLLEYYAVDVGNLDNSTILIDEINFYKVPITNFFFRALFRGFAMHGGIKYSDWTLEKLRGVWRSFLELARDEEIEDVYMNGSQMVWALRALSKCGGKEALFDAWEELREGGFGEWNEVTDDMVAKTVRVLIEKIETEERGEGWTKNGVGDWGRGPTRW